MTAQNDTYEFYTFLRPGKELLRSANRADIKVFITLMEYTKMHDFVAHVTQVEMSERTKLSRTSVQKAYSNLQASGAVKVAKYGRVYVNPAVAYKGEYRYAMENRKEFERLSAMVPERKSDACVDQEW